MITGASGLLGSKIIIKAEKQYDVHPTHISSSLFAKSLKLDITDENQVKSVFNKVKPDIVIHTAAVTNVDLCETDKTYASRVNAEGTKILAKACNKVGARIVYVSTDYVFDGEKGSYTEEDNPNPVNYYGLSKLIGEKYVTELNERFMILRTSVLYDVHLEKMNFVMWVIKSLEENKRVAIVEDHYNSPTLASNLAEVILEMVAMELRGIYHVAGSERVSRYLFALKIAETFNFNANLIQPIQMSELKAWTARRPKDSSLCIDKIKKKVNAKLLDVTQGLSEMNKNWVKMKLKE